MRRASRLLSAVHPLFSQQTTAALANVAAALPCGDLILTTNLQGSSRFPTQHTSLTHQRFMSHCCPGLDREPPKELFVEYDPADVDKFIELADAIEAAFPDIIVHGNAEADGRPGSFEVTTQNGAHLFSKLASSCYPDASGLVKAIELSRAQVGSCTVDAAQG